MIYISHRGNINGSFPLVENNPEYIYQAHTNGYNVEADVWLIKDKLYLGHDSPKYEIGVSFLQCDWLWCHAKNLDALSYMLKNDVHCFWHQKDDATLTSKGYVWTYPGKMLVANSVAVLPETVDHEWPYLKASAICSDRISDYRNLM